MKKYNEAIGVNPNFVEMESKILNFWKEEKIFEKSLEKTKNKKEYIFYDGPPFANGLPHYGHLLTSCAKDVIGRFQTMNERYVQRIFGWDCHGLPAEMAAEKALGISGRIEIEKYGIEKFNDYCKKDVMKFSEEWKKYISRIGRWVDMENAYKTMDKNFMESVLWAFKNLYDQGLVYQKLKVMPYSWACQTPLSNFETRLDNSYREKESKSIIVKFEINIDDFKTKICDDRLKNIEKAYILVWTTTPWTLPSNLALAVSENFDYDVFIDSDSKKAYIGFEIEKFLKDLKVEYNKEKKPENIIIKIKGSELCGLGYKPLFSYFLDVVSENCYKIYHADFVTTCDGTGVVHLAPGFGEEDFDLCQEKGIGIFENSSLEEENEMDLKRISPAVPVDNSGKFLSIIKDFAGMHVFDSNDEIIKALKISDNWVKTSQYFHSYPHCWRTDTPIIYKAMPSYCIEVSKFRDRLSELNSKINWIPEGVKDGIFGNWLKEAKDWAVSRNRFFGTPIPIWVSDDEEYPYTKVFGSISELEEFFGPYYAEKNNGKKLKITDLHRPFIDELIAPNPADPTGKSFLRRVKDVFDCWFESGAMSFAEDHYPFNLNSYSGPSFDSKDFDPKIHKPKRLPADFIVEYTAQTRGWFYTLIVLSTLIFDEIPFKNCICHGVILDDKGQKLSKRLGNYIDPLEAMNEYSADALRYVMLSSPVMNGGELLIDKEGRMLTDALKTIQKPLWSALNFFILYAHEDQPDLKLYSFSDLTEWSKILKSSENNKNLEYDFFLMLRVFELAFEIYESLSSYKIMNSYSALRDFIDDLNNFYIRANREKFWGCGMNEEKQRAFNVLYSVLYYLSISIAPILPFFAEIIFWRINDDSSKSVHLEKFIFTEDNLESLDAFKKFHKENEGFLESMKILKKVFYHGRAIRDDKLGIRLRQPLRTAKIITNLEIVKSNFDFFKQEISRELNIHDVSLVDENIQKEEVLKFFSRKVKLNTRLLGRELGKEIQSLKALIDSGNFELSSDLKTLNVGNYSFTDGQFFTETQLLPYVQNQSAIAFNETGKYAIIWIDDFMDKDLAFEGIMRDLVRSIQDGRKTMFEISDRIELYVWSFEKEVIDVCQKFKDYIMSQTLSKKFEFKLFENELDQSKFEESLIDSGFGIFGYNVHNTFSKKDLELKLSFKKI